MKILLTGATGYIGQRLLPLLAAAGHDVVCLVRDPRRFALPDTPARSPARPGEQWPKATCCSPNRWPTCPPTSTRPTTWCIP